MYTIIQGRAPKRGNSYTVELGRTDSFVEAVRIAQLSGGASVQSSFSKTGVSKDHWHKHFSGGGKFTQRKLKPVCTRAAMLVMCWLIQRA